MPLLSSLFEIVRVEKALQKHPTFCKNHYRQRVEYPKPDEDLFLSELGKQAAMVVAMSEPAIAPETILELKDDLSYLSTWKLWEHLFLPRL